MDLPAFLFLDPLSTISPIGSLLGLLYGFIDAFIGGAILAWLYNRIAGRSAPAAPAL